MNPLAPYLGDSDSDEEVGAVSTGQAILIQVKNVSDLVKAQGGAAGGIAYWAVPSSITSKVYTTMQTELATKLKEQGVDADVKVVDPLGFQAAGTNPIWKPIALSACGVGILTLAWKIFGRHK